MTDGQRQAITRLGPKYCLPTDPATTLHLDQVFGNDNPVTLEIGCGMGETTAQLAADNPHRNYLGIEVYTAGIGALLSRLQKFELSNVRLIQHDAVDVLRKMLAPAVLDQALILFPDPWPKKRHHKRRLIQTPFVELLVSRLKPGACLHCATDWEPYAEQMMEVLSACDQLENVAGAGCWLPRPSWRPVTKFEQRGLRRGYRVRDLQFRRC